MAADNLLNDLRTDAQALHSMLWGCKWLHMRTGTISNAEIGHPVVVSPVDSVDPNDNDDDDEPAPVDEDEFIYGNPLVESTKKLKYECYAELGPLIYAFGFRHFGDVLVVRNEYIDLYEALTNGSLKKSPAIIITGQSDIGKTACLLYLLLRRLELMLPTAIQFHASHYFLFDHKGGAVYGPHYRNGRLEACWALSDSNDDVVTPCEAFRGYATRIIQAATPERKRWHRWSKRLGGCRVVMELPTALEIGAIMKERGSDPKNTLANVRKWGPSIRAVIALDMSSWYEQELEANARAAAWSACQDPSLIPLAGDDETRGSDVLFIRPVRNRPTAKVPVDFSPKALYCIPTKHLSTFFDDSRIMVSNVKSLQLFSTFNSHSFTRSMDGWAYEQRMHSRLATSSAQLIIFRDGEISYVAPSSSLRPGTIGGLKSADACVPFYWIPSVISFPGVDGVLGDGQGNLYALQATTANERTDPTDGLREVWNRVNKKVRRCCWNFVVVAEDQKTAHKHLGTFSEELKNVVLGQNIAVKVWACVIRRY